MFFHLKSLICSVIFLLTLEVLISNPNLIWYVLFFLFLFSVWSARKIGKKYNFSLVPIIFSGSSLMLFYLIDLKIDRQVFAVISSIIFYFIFLGIVRIKNYSKDKTARGIFAGGLISTIFFFYAGFYGLYINFFIPLWILMLVFFFVTFLSSYHYLGIIAQDKKKVLTYSLILGFSMSEISWIINFWPFGYLTTGVIALIFYYMFWDLAQSYFTKNLSKKKIVANLVFFSLLISLVLISSRWQLAV